ncbi:helix-turn-helix transcriptional regulator [Arsenophonus endosymbiont of Aleurodicus floccissimus]
MQWLNSKEIARRLDVCPSTVESHLKTIYGKVNVAFGWSVKSILQI